MMFEANAQAENEPRLDAKRVLQPHRPALRQLEGDGMRAPTKRGGEVSGLESYSLEIYAHLAATEERFMAKQDYMSQQPDINYKMRAILIDWLVSVHLKFKLAPETLFLTVNLIDRYLSKRVVTRQQLQLVGVAAMLIASKYEEIYPPEVKEFVYITDKAYTKEQVVEMEGEMLGTLEYSITCPSSWRFLERNVRVAELDETYSFFSRYLLELSLVEYHMLRYKPSLLAAAVTYIAIKLHHRDAVWSLALSTSTQLSEMQLQQAVKDLLVLFQAAPKHTLTGVKDKFARRDFMEVSKMKLE